MARPPKYRKNFHPEDFIRLSKQGKNITQIALEWDVHRDTIYEWANKNKQFSDTIKKGKAFAEAWYINLGQMAMIGKAKINREPIKVELGMYVWLTKNLFKWSDKIEENIKATVSEPIKVKTNWDEEDEAELNVNPDSPGDETAHSATKTDQSK